MPVSINVPQRQQQADPLEKLAAAVGIAKNIYGIHADSKMLDQAMAKKAEEDKLRGLQIKEAERKESEAVQDSATSGPLIDTIRAQAKARGLTIPEGISVKQARTAFDAFLKPNDPKAKDPLAEEMARQRLADAKEKRDRERSPEGRLAKLNSGDKARFDNSKLGLQSTQAMDSALNNGDWTFTLYGDNDYTRNLRMAAEAFGRMQSGGAINKDEEKRFLEMAPTSKDSKEQQRKKLEQMQALFKDRLQTLGFSTDEAGVPLQEIQYGKQDSNPAAVPPDVQQAAKDLLNKRLKDARK